MINWRSRCKLRSKAELQRWLGDLIEVRELEVNRNEGTLAIVLSYVIVDSGEVQVETFQRRVAE